MDSHLLNRTAVMWRHIRIDSYSQPCLGLTRLLCKVSEVLFDFAPQIMLTLLRANSAKLAKITGTKGKETLQAVRVMSEFTVMWARDMFI